MEFTKNLTFAIKGEELVHISEASSGLECGCTCPACGARLVARKGPKRAHHFAHHTGEGCEYGYESSLHLAAKRILSRANKMFLPEVFLRFPESNKEDELIEDAKEINIDSVELERRQGDVIPDVIVHSGEEKIFVEIYVTHRVDEDKQHKLQKQGINVIEIDLSKEKELASEEMLSSILLGNDPRKNWVCHKEEEMWYNRFVEAAEEMCSVERGMAIHVDHCPISARVWNGKPYANLWHDCDGCPYCIENLVGSILCTGKRRISSIDDFSVPERERIQKAKEDEEREEREAIARGECPQCKGKLVLHNSIYGTFWGCSTFPNCKVKVVTDPRTGELIVKR